MSIIVHNTSFPNDGQGDELRTAFEHQNRMNEELYESKVDKIEGRGLSENNYSDDEKNKLRDIEEMAQKNVQSDWRENDPALNSFIKNRPNISDLTNIESKPIDAIFEDSDTFTIPDNYIVISVFKVNNILEELNYKVVGNALTILNELNLGDKISIRGVIARGEFAPVVAPDLNTVAIQGSVSSVTIQSPNAVSPSDLVPLGQVEQMLEDFPAENTNIANTDFTFTANRTQNLNAKKLKFTNGDFEVPALTLTETAENSKPNKINTVNGLDVYFTDRNGVQKKLLLSEAYKALQINKSANLTYDLSLERKSETALSISANNTINILLQTPVTTEVNEYILILKMTVNVPTITYPSGIKWRGKTPLLTIDTRWTFIFEKVLFDGVWETYGCAIQHQI